MTKEFSIHIVPWPEYGDSSKTPIFKFRFTSEVLGRSFNSSWSKRLGRVSLDSSWVPFQRKYPTIAKEVESDLRAALQ